MLFSGPNVINRWNCEWVIYKVVIKAAVHCNCSQLELSDCLFAGSSA